MSSHYKFAVPIQEFPSVGDKRSVGIAEKMLREAHRTPQKLVFPLEPQSGTFREDLSICYRGTCPDSSVFRASKSGNSGWFR